MKKYAVDQKFLDKLFRTLLILTAIVIVIKAVL